MAKSASLTGLLVRCLLVAAGAAGIAFYYQHASSEYRIRQLEEENRIKQEIIARLEAERRVADLLVTDQQTVGGVKTTTLLFVEYDRAGHPLPARTFTVRGENVHIDAMVIKFDHALVESGDALKGKSIALFTKIYGDAQSADSAASIDTPNAPPDIYRGTDPRVLDFETSLWKRFWTLAYDEKARTEAGVRALGGHGVWEPLRPDTLYTLTLESDGGLNLNREPLRGVYKEALRKKPD
jgi:hypothetical protein